MAKISWNETRDRAIRFSREWSTAKHEHRDKQTFWNEFFECFGVPRKSVAIFEHSVAKARGSYNFLDLFWPGVLLVEHKSAGGSLNKAESQAFAYLADLADQGNHDNIPRYIVLCDFARFVLFDLEPDLIEEGMPRLDDENHYSVTEFPLSDLHKHIREFAFIKGEKAIRLDPEDPANLEATQLLADLHDALESTGFRGHSLERLLVRLLFCLFAEDTGIFDAPGSFTAFIERTREDGADLGLHLAQLFQVLDTPPAQRQTTLDQDLAMFPYVNGGLFQEQLPIASFTSSHREALLKCCRFYWARISPAVFGSLFQGILDTKERRKLGAHYTTERDILKLLRSLFLDDLRSELDAALADRSTRRIERLRDYQRKLRGLRFFDPACGCGNFLILAYREVRRLEHETLIAIRTVEGSLQRQLDIRELAQVDVDQFFGLEICEWPVRIAEVGLWLTDHQCNVELADALGQSFRRLPLRATPTLQVANALRTDWGKFLPPTENVLVLGNPPFIGAMFMSDEQRRDLASIAGELKGIGVLDYVSAWYFKAAKYIQGTRIRCAFVSTNSITQGEQAGLLWNCLFSQYKLKIHFAHRTFPWTSEAKGKAHVHVVIVGFGAFDLAPKQIFDYEGDEKRATVTTVINISPYLVEGSDKALSNRSNPICDVPKMAWGSQPRDGGHLLLEPEEKKTLLRAEPAAAPWIRRFTGAEEFLNGGERYCLWLTDIPPHVLKGLPLVMARVDGVRKMRLASRAAATQKLAATPSIFAQIAQPQTDYLIVPLVSSIRRRYIPVAFMSHKVIASNLCCVIEGASLYHFGVFSSSMHMAWVRAVCGRLKSDYRYSKDIVYNNYPWPTTASSKELAAVDAAAQAVLDARSSASTSTLADLYDPLTMPPQLVKAHAALDRAVERCYRKEPFASDRARVEYLFTLHEKIAAPLLSPQKKPKKQK